MLKEQETQSGDLIDPFGQTTLCRDQIKSLTQALKLALEEETNRPLQGDVPGALAIAIERAAEDALSMFKAHYQPGVGS